MIGLPYFSSFVAKNTTTFNTVVPRLPAELRGGIQVLREIDSQLPFAGLLDAAVDRYVAAEPRASVVPCKTIYYRDGATDFEPYMVLRALGQRATFDAPEVPHLSSPEFSFTSWKRLVAAPEPALVA